MSKVAITKSKLDALAAKIATKSGATLPLTLDEMKDEADMLTKPSGTKSISQNGTGIDVAEYQYVDVNVPSSGDPDMPTITVVWDDNWEAPISASFDKTYQECVDYLDGGGSDVKVIETNQSGTAEFLPMAFLTISGGAFYQTYSVYFGTLPYYDVRYNSDGSVNITNPSQLRETLNVTANGTYYPSGGSFAYIAEVNVNVQSGAPNLQAKTNISPTESSQTITADSGYDGLSSVQIDAVSSSYVGSGITRRSSTDLSASGATVTVPAGYYESQASKAVASGTEGTPSATKGTVSDHSVTVTPSVTNTAGYISGGTKTGTGVSVSASELVSGTLNVTSSGTKDVTNYASASIPAGTVTAPSSISGTTATVSTGTNTLTLTKTVSVTPNVTTAGYISSGTAGNASVSLQASVTTQAAQTIHPSTSNQTIAASRYLTGAQTINAVTHNLDASKILSGTTFKIGDSADDDCVASVAGTLSFQTIYSGSSAPSSSTGVNGDIYIQS